MEGIDDCFAIASLGGLFDNGDWVSVFEFGGFDATGGDSCCSNGWDFCCLFFVCSTMESMLLEEFLVFAWQ